jgi:hypothetical protein
MWQDYYQSGRPTNYVRLRGITMIKKIFFVTLCLHSMCTDAAIHFPYRTCSVTADCSGLFCRDSAQRVVCIDGKCVCEKGEYARIDCANNEDVCQEPNVKCPEGMSSHCSVGPINDKRICICEEK